MTQKAEKKRDIYNSVTDAVRTEMRQMIANARHAALAWHSDADGHPMVTRVGIATDAHGNPLLFISALALHSAALAADNRCGLLVGELGKGDPLAHPRLSLKCVAQPLPAAEVDHARRAYLAAHPKARNYIDLPDFQFVRLNVLGGTFNGGFGRAYQLEAGDCTTS